MENMPQDISYSKARKQVQYKFHEYKKKQQELETLGERNSNIIFTPSKISKFLQEEGQTSPWATQQKANKEAQVMELLTVDSTLNQFALNLKKQAELQHKQLLLKQFPQRYQDLLNKEQYLQTLESKHKEQRMKSKQESQKMIKKINELQATLLQKNASLSQKQLQYKAMHEGSVYQLKQCIKKKDLQVRLAKEELSICQGKLDKIRNDYNNVSTVVMELRQQEVEMGQENQRLIGRLKEHEHKTQKAYKKILELEAELIVVNKQMARQVQLEGKKYIQKIQLQQQQIQNLQERLQFKDSLIQLSDNQRQNLIASHEEEDKKRHEQIQEIRQQYLEALKSMDQFQQKLEENNTNIEHSNKISELQINKLKKQLDDKYLIIGEYKINLDAKQNYIFTLQQRIQAMITRHQGQIDMLHTKEQKAMEKLKDQYKCKYQELVKINRELLLQKEDMVKQLVQIQAQNNEDFQKIEEEVIQNSNKFMQQKETSNKKCLELEQLNSYLVAENKKLLASIRQKEQQSVGQAKIAELQKYKTLVETLRDKILQSNKNQKDKANKSVQMYRELLEENRKYKKQLLLCKYL